MCCTDTLVKWNEQHNTLVKWRTFWCNRDCRKERPSVDERKRQLDEWASAVDLSIKAKSYKVESFRYTDKLASLEAALIRIYDPPTDWVEV